jgi:predicted DNA-binding protein (MmcQ/YjbR family)
MQMTRRELIGLCLAFPDAYEDYPFDDIPGAPDSWTVMRHRENRKSFALIYERGGLRINLKCEPMRGGLLRQTYRGVTAGYHMNKEHWVTAEPDSDLPADELRAMIRESWELTQPRPRRQRT